MERQATASGLLERDSEIDALEAAIAAVTAGDAGVVLVEGPAGIGKSRLLAEARREAGAAGVRVLLARGGELERDFPFGVVRQLFEPSLADAPLAERVLGGAAATARAVFETLGDSADEGAADTAYSTLHGLYWLTLNLAAEGPLALVVDDLHWCDRPSLRFLAYLVRRMEGSAVLVVGSLRPAEPGADVALLAELAGDPLTVEVMPGPLTVEAVRDLVAARLGDGVEEPFAVACHASTGGNPLLLSECLKALQVERVPPVAASVGIVEELGPRAAGRAVLLRLARLSPNAVAVARALAVLGDGADVPVVARLAGLREPEVVDAIAALIRAEILRPDPPLGFVHPLVRAAVYQDVSPAERQLQHEGAAGILRDMGAAPEQVAAHLLVAPPRGDEAVVDVLRAAARSALKKGAADNAISSLSRALEEPPPPADRPRILAELGFAEMLTYAPAGKDHLRAAYESLTDPVERGHAAEGVVRSTLFTGDPDEGLALARRVQAELPPGADDLRRRIEATELLALFFGARDVGGARERLVRYRTERVGEDVGARMLASIAAWGWTLDGGSADEVASLALWSQEDGLLLEADSGLFSVISGIALALAERPEAQPVFDAIQVDAHTRGSVFAMTGRHLWGGYALLLRGELEDAEEDVRASLEKISLWGVPASAYSCAFISEVLVERGSLLEARAVLGQAETPPAAADRQLLLHRAEGELLLAEGRPAEVLERVAAFRRDAGWRSNPVYIPCDALAALALDRLGRTEEALELATRQLDAARHWGTTGAVGRALRLLGTIERADGLAHLEEAVAVLEGSPARLEQAKALAALGARLRRDRRPSDARDPLRRALELAEACGAGALVDEVRSEIYASGARPRTAAVAGVGSLTASERRVAELAAGGQSNRDIAQALYVTPKTVEVHLSSVYRKLGIASRRELDRALVTTP